jgi:hypothetical protein
MCFFIKAQVNAHATNIILRQEVKILCQMYALTIGIQKLTKEKLQKMVSLFNKHIPSNFQILAYTTLMLLHYPNTSCHETGHIT